VYIDLLAMNGCCFLFFKKNSELEVKKNADGSILLASGAYMSKVRSRGKHTEGRAKRERENER
jgi:hypothetical protein